MKISPYLTCMSQKDRKLAAILFADIQGYTTLMEQDEEKALRIISKFEKVLNEKVFSFDGEIVKSYGDGCLVLFDSAVSAMHCAESMQSEFQKDLIVPLRIGVHLGEVVFKNQDVFGDGINIASRIESMGIPGSVLISKNVQEAIRNQASLPTTSLGQFKFKNVSLPLEVFALSAPGVIVPKPEQLKGKVDNKKSKRFTVGHSIVIAALLGLVIMVVYQMNHSLGEGSRLSSEVKEKRLAVLNFANQTLDPDLDVFGNMISDWLTKGLMESGEANIVKTTGFQNEIAAADLSANADPDFVKSTGINLIINGRYYQAESDLIVIAELIDINTGKILQTHQVSQPKTATMTLLNDLTNEVVNYWAVKDNIQLNQKPPNFEAYKLYIQGNELYTTDAEAAMELFQKSFNRDTSFLQPLFRVSTLALNLGDTERSDEVMDYLASKKDDFSKFEKIDYDIRITSRENNFIRAAQLSEEKLRLDPRDEKANYNVAYFYTLANYPLKSLEALNNYALEINDNSISMNWRTALACHALKKTDQCDKVNSVVKQVEFSKFSVILAVMDLQCLIEMDSVEQAIERLEYYNTIGVYNPIGAPSNTELLPIFCNELLIEGHSTLLSNYQNKLENWVKQVSAIPYNHVPPDIFNNRPFRTNEAKGYMQFYMGNYNAAINHWLNEVIPDSNWSDQMERASRLGYLYGKTGNHSEAQRYLSYLDQITIDNTYFKSNQLYYRSRILSALSNYEEAVASLEKALNEGMILYRPSVFEDDPFLIDIHQNSRFQELIKPKG